MPRKSFVVLSLSVLFALPWADGAFAQQQKHKPRKHPAPEAATTLAPRSSSHNPCAQYGAGFVRAPGSDTCVRIGGYVGVDVGGRF
jgi:hypothetical protein